jgi:hypothetical protein
LSNPDYRSIDAISAVNSSQISGQRLFGISICWNAKLESVLAASSTWIDRAIADEPNDQEVAAIAIMEDNNMWGAGQVFAETETPQERAAVAVERRRRRMHTGDTEQLQSELDRLRVYVTALFQLLVARGVFTAEEAKRLVTELESSTIEESDACRDRDVVTGEELPPEENPFRGLAGPSKSNWRVRVMQVSVVLVFFLVCFVWVFVTLLTR